MGAELMQARAPTLSVQLTPYPVEVRPSVNTGGGREYCRPHSGTLMLSVHPGVLLQCDSCQCFRPYFCVRYIKAEGDMSLT